jgi:hypothetical protein
MKNFGCHGNNADVTQGAYATGLTRLTEAEQLSDQAWLQVLKAASIKMAVFWVVASCRLVWVYRRFRGLYCLHHQGDDWLHGATTQKTAIFNYQILQGKNNISSAFHRPPVVSQFHSRMLDQSTAVLMNKMNDRMTKNPYWRIFLEKLIYTQVINLLLLWNLKVHCRAQKSLLTYSSEC